MTTSAGPARPRVGVLALQGAVSEHEAALREVGAEPVPVLAPEDLAGVDAIVIPGGESTTLGLLGEESGLLPALREVIAAGMPALGTCAGMIVLARATTSGAQPLVGGIDMVVRRNAFGRQRASFEVPLALPALGPQPFDAVFIRAPWIERAGAGVEVLAEWDGHGVAARQGELMVTAFHPELTGERRLHRWIVERARARREAVRDDARQGGERVRAQ